MSYRLAIFDFDGTLADSFPFFVSVFNQLATQHGFRTIESEQVDRYRRLDAKTLMKQVELPAWKLPQVAGSFMALMRRNTKQVSLFDGIEQALQHLAAHDVQLAIVSSNAEDNVRAILGEDSSRRIGHFECGMSMFGKRNSLKKVLKRCAVPAEHAIYIGDQPADLQAAQAAGIASGAVAWGYAPLASLREHDPTRTFERVTDLHGIAGSTT